jgi:aldehyde dehydrogenase (NAD+)
MNVSPDSPAMQEEIFGPILPILDVSSVEEVIDFVNAPPSPINTPIELASTSRRILASRSTSSLVLWATR